jgi:hypothetical protein
MQTEKRIPTVLKFPDGEQRKFIMTVRDGDFLKMQNDIASNKDKASVMHNFVMTCTDPRDKATVRELLSVQKGLSSMLFGFIGDQYMTKVEVELGEFDDTPMESTAAA